MAKANASIIYKTGIVMIRLKPLLETQLIREALPISKAKKYANIKRNPAIEARLSDILSMLAEQPGAKLSRRQDRVAIPFQHKFDVDSVRQFYNSDELINFSNALIDLRRDINHFIKNQLDDNTKPFPTFDGPEQVILGQLPDQYGRAVKMSKYIKMLLSYQVKRKLDHLSIIIKTNPDTGEQGVRKTNGEWNTIDSIKQSMKKDAQTKFNQLMQEYDAIPEVKRYRQNKDKSYYLVFSKHSYDVAGMSTDRGWSSCMNLYGGINSYYIQYDIEEGTMVVYLVTEDDLNITNPTARIAIKPFINTEDSDDVYYQAERRVYGTSPETFLSTVDQLLDSIQPDKQGLFRLIDTLYCDSTKQVVKFSDPDISEKMSELVSNKQQATTVDEAKYIMWKYMNIEFDLLDRFHFEESDKLYVSAGDQAFHVNQTLGYSPINIAKCSQFTITSPIGADSYKTFPLETDIMRITNPLQGNFKGMNTLIHKRLVLDAFDTTSHITNFEGLKPGLKSISLAFAKSSKCTIDSFSGIPATVNAIDIIKLGVVLDMTIDEFVSQLKPIRLQRFTGFPIDLHSDFLDNPTAGKFTQSIAKKIQSIPIDTSLPDEYHQLSKTYRFLAWLLSELPTMTELGLMNSTLERGDIKEKWFPQNW